MKTTTYILSIIILMFCCIFVYAENFDVSNPAEFQAALNSASANGEADVINVASGTYNIIATLNYYSVEDYTISVIGASAANTILDGADVNKLLSMETTSPNADISISNIRFTNGYDTHGAVSLNLESARAMIL